MIRNLVITLLTVLSLTSCVIVPDRHYQPDRHYHGWHDLGRYHNQYPDYRR